MARNRKRAKERRARRPQGASASTATAGREHELSGSELDAAPDPIAHAAPDVELAEAQLALGRPELTDGDAAVVEPDAGQDGVSADSLSAGSASTALSPAAPGSERELHPAERQRIGSRLIHFLQGSWRELQRVQWPDRRQVMQATGVVLGFVIVAGIYLALADTAASKLMSYILK